MKQAKWDVVIHIWIVAPWIIGLLLLPYWQSHGIPNGIIYYCLFGLSGIGSLLGVAVVDDRIKRKGKQ